MSKYTQFYVFLISLVLAVTFYIITNIMQLRYSFYDIYPTLIIIEITLLGFFITVISLIILIFSNAMNSRANYLKIKIKSNGYSRLYSYFINALYVFGVSSIIFFLLWTTNITEYASEINSIIIFILALTAGYVLLGILIVKSTVNTFITPVK